jgi:hypothetical protein
MARGVKAKSVKKRFGRILVLGFLQEALCGYHVNRSALLSVSNRESGTNHLFGFLEIRYSGY